MQDGAEHTDQVKLQKQRASRRKRILENAQNRLEKLKNPQWRYNGVLNDYNSVISN